jgi:hypothetical protein
MKEFVKDRSFDAVAFAGVRVLPASLEFLRQEYGRSHSSL